jgi:predicted HicB family RNase H-like nuclease
MLAYNGYVADADYDDDAETFYGKVVNAGVLLSFRGRTVKELKESFRNVVEAYLEECAEDGTEPEKPYSGTLTVRVDPAVHRRVALKAATAKVSMNRYIEELLARDTEDVADLETSWKAVGTLGSSKRTRRPKSKGAAGTRQSIARVRRAVARSTPPEL